MTIKHSYFFRNTALTSIFSCLMLSGAQAAQPLWSFVPQTPTDITVAKGNNAQVIYTVHNQSSRAKTLVMKPIIGISQSAPCQLPAKGSCTLTLNVNGSALRGDVLGGPVLCQQGNDLQCYQPSAANLLHIRLTQSPPVQQFTVTPSAGANGSISPLTAQVVNAGSSLIFTATPNASFGINQWLVDGNMVQNGGTSYQLNNIQANHSVEVTFNQTTLSSLTQNLTLSINSPSADPALSGTPRIIRITNTGSIPANNVQVNDSGLPSGTAMNAACQNVTLAPNDTCDITIIPGSNASLDSGSNACTTAPGSEPLPTVVTVSADNASSTNVNVLVLGYGCIYQGGYLFSVDETSSTTVSIGGKVAALADESSPLAWSTILNTTSADNTTDGLPNTTLLETPVGQYPAAQACSNKSDGWYLPAICELGRYNGLGSDAGCGTTLPNLHSTLYLNASGALGEFIAAEYWSSTEYSSDSLNSAWDMFFTNGGQGGGSKTVPSQVRCIRAFTP